MKTISFIKMEYELFNVTGQDLRLDYDINHFINPELSKILEDRHDIRIIVSGKHIYITTVDAYDARMIYIDSTLGNLASAHAQTIMMKKTFACINQTRDGVIYTLGNIYGMNSIIMGPKYANVLRIIQDNKLFGVPIMDLSLKLVDDKYSVISYKI